MAFTFGEELPPHAHLRARHALLPPVLGLHFNTPRLAPHTYPFTTHTVVPTSALPFYSLHIPHTPAVPLPFFPCSIPHTHLCCPTHTFLYSSPHHPMFSHTICTAFGPPVNHTTSVHLPTTCLPTDTFNNRPSFAHLAHPREPLPPSFAFTTRIARMPRTFIFLFVGFPVYGFPRTTPPTTTTPCLVAVYGWCVYVIPPTRFPPILALLHTTLRTLFVTFFYYAGVGCTFGYRTTPG